MKKPFIKLFSNNNDFYFYDVNYNKIIEISKESYDILRSILCRDEYDICDLNDECKQYVNVGLLQHNQIKDEATKSRGEIISILNSGLKSLLLQVTRDCNLRCKYCFYSGKYSEIRTHQRTYMNKEDCESIIDFFIHRSSSDSVLNIGFYGGEPLLNFDLIKHCIYYVRNRYSQKKVQYSITTNAILLEPFVCDFLKENNFLVTISIDGPNNIHDANRIFANGKGSYEILYKNVEYFYEKHREYFKDNVRYNAVATQNWQKVEHYFKNDRIFKEINGKLTPLNNYHANFLTYNNFNMDKIDQDISLQRIRSYVNYLKNPESRNNYSVRINSIIDKLSKEPNGPLYDAIPSGVCVPGASRLFATVNGDFYMCEKINDESSEFKIGDLKKGWNIENIYKLVNISNESLEFGCKQCWAINLCNMCAAKICAMNQDRLNKKCNEIRKSLENDLKDICVLSKLRQ